MNKFDEDYELSLRRQVDADLIYKTVFPVERIERFAKDSERHILDREFAVDVVIHTKCGIIFTVQEKFRRFWYYKQGFRDFTLEYVSNNRGVEGEFFRLCTDLYCYGWENENETDFVAVQLFYVAPVKKAIVDKSLHGYLNENEEHGTASFYAYPFSEFEDEWFLYSTEVYN